MSRRLLGKARRSLAESSVVQLVGVVAKHLPLTFDVVEDSNLLADPLGKPARLDGWRCDQYARRGQRPDAGAALRRITPDWYHRAQRLAAHHREKIGRHYASELQRRFDRVSAYRQFN
jgi:hypothetical protein